MRDEDYVHFLYGAKAPRRPRSPYLLYVSLEKSVWKLCFLSALAPYREAYIKPTFTQPRKIPLDVDNV